MSLTKEEKALMLSLMQKMLEDDTEVEEVVEKPKKRGRPKKEQARLPAAKTPKKRGRPAKDKVAKDIEKQLEENQVNITNDKPKGPVKKSAPAQKMKLKKAPVIKPIDTSPNTPNRFLEMVSPNAEKADSKIDKLLIGNNKRTPRVRTQIVVNDVKCTRCNSYYDEVLASLTWQEEDENVFICPECGNK